MTSTATATDAESPEGAETATDEVATATDAESPERAESPEGAETATDEVADSETATDEAAKQEVESLETGQNSGRAGKLRGCPRCSSAWQQSQMAFCPNFS